MKMCLIAVKFIYVLLLKNGCIFVAFVVSLEPNTVLYNHHILYLSCKFHC